MNVQNCEIHDVARPSQRIEVTTAKTCKLDFQTHSCSIAPVQLLYKFHVEMFRLSLQL